MKSLVLSAMICAATVGTSVAGTYVNLPAGNAKKEYAIGHESVAAFKQAITFHQHNVNVLFSQFGIAREALRQSAGSHADIDRDKAFFIKVYQEDIDAGVRVEASKKAIAEIEATYARKHAERDAYEDVQLSKLREQLCAELKREHKQFKRAQRKYAGFVNEETLPLLKKAEQYFADAMDLAQNGDVDHMVIAAR